MSELRPLPGGALIEAGLADLAAGRETVPSLLVAVATHRLRQAGLDVPAHDFHEAELRLYRLLGRDDASSAYSRYNALLRRLVSFAHALEREEGKALRAGRGT